MKNLTANLSYSDQSSRINIVSGIPYDNIAIWIAIRKAKDEYFKGVAQDKSSEDKTGDFIKWLLDTYGILISPAQDGYHLSPKFEIIRPDKYTMFMLKYS